MSRARPGGVAGITESTIRKVIDDALAAERVARDGLTLRVVRDRVARVTRGADTSTNVRTLIISGTEIVVVTGGTSGLLRVGADTSTSVTSTGHVTLVERRADDGRSTNARARATLVNGSTSVAIVTGGTIGLSVVFTDTAARVTTQRDVTSSGGVASRGGHGVTRSARGTFGGDGAEVGRST